MKYILIIFFFYSCSSSKKIKTELRTVSYLDNISSVKIDSSNWKREKSDEGISFEKNMKITFRNFDGTDTTWKGGSTSRTPGPLTIYVPGIGNVDTRNLSSIEINNKEKRHSKKQKQDNSRTVATTFAETHSEIKEDQKTETVKKNEVEVPSLGFSIWYVVAGVLLPVLAWLFIMWKKRKKKKL